MGEVSKCKSLVSIRAAVVKLFKVLSIQILIAWVGLELLLNLFSPFPDPYKSIWGLSKHHKYLPAWNYHRMEPPYTSVFVTGPLTGVSTRKVTLSINRFGLLFHESVALRTEKEELRIGVIGGSAVECSALETTSGGLASRLQDYLVEAFPGRRVTVLNMGITGQDTRTHLATVAQLAGAGRYSNL